MKVLVVCSGNSNQVSPFVQDQVNNLINQGIIIEYFLIKGFGIIGYLQNRKKLLKKVREFKPNLIHAHYGLSGLLANFQRRVPVITTYHGCDINRNLLFIFSKVSIYLSEYNIFVSSKLAKKAGVKKKYSIISCGVDLNSFKILDRIESRKNLGLDIDKKYVLFSSAFSNKVKNYPLAAKAISLLRSKGCDVKLIEFKGYSREESIILMNAVDCVLVTSLRESGPLVIKEAMAVNTCAVSVDVGDVREITNNLEGYFIAANNAEDVADKMYAALLYNKRTNSREKIMIYELENTRIAEKIIKVFEDVLEKRRNKKQKSKKQNV